jgi:hypothetical protein
MTENKFFDNEREGFKVGEYFVTFPPGDFVKEDKNGMYVMVDVYKMENNKAVKVNSKIPPEVEQYINEELNRILLAAVEAHEDKDINK